MSPKWTFRDWLLPWILVAASTGTLVVGSPSIPAAAACLVVLASIPLRRGPWRLPRWAPYLLTLPFLAAFALQLASLRERGTGWEGIFTYPGWYFALLSGLQAGSIGRSSRTSHAAWSALAAQILSGPVAGAVRFGICVVQLFFLILLLRGLSWKGRSGGRFDGRLVPGVLLPLAGALALWSHGGRFAGAIAPHGRFRGSEAALKGFSPVSTLGTFASEYGDRDDEVAVRAWSARPVPFLQGSVLDIYGAGAWRRSGPPRAMESPRNAGEASVFCPDRRDPGPEPDGWLLTELPTEAHLLKPSGAGCVGMVTDSVMMWPAGSVVSPGAEFGRGIWWWNSAQPDSAPLPSDLAVPRALEGLLDTALRECGIRPGAPSREASRSLGRWFAREFRYSLVPGKAVGEDPLRRFFRERTGYCEYFASLATLMLRRAGIPARYATGFAYPDRGRDGSWVFRRGNAHAWLLVRDSATGWSVFDPTPSSDRPVPSASGRNGRIEGWEGSLRFWWHGMRDGNWRKVLDRMSELQDAWGNRGLGAGAAIAFAAAVAFAIRRRRRKTRESEWEIRLAAAEALLARRGFLRAPGETVGRFLERLPDSVPSEVVESLRDYQKRRFAPGSGR